MGVTTRRKSGVSDVAPAGAASPASASKRRRAPSRSRSAADSRGEDRSVHHAHDDRTPLRVRVYVLTYFFSSLTIDKMTFLGVHWGWILSSLAEWLGLPICHTNVQLQNIANPSEVAEFGYEGGPRDCTGVYQCAPGMNPHLAFTRQQRCYLGETDLTHAELVAIVADLERRWPARAYNLLSRNCNHFCDALVAELLPGQRIPAFINRGAKWLCAFPFPGFAPWYVRTRVRDGGSWTAGEVCEMAAAEREAMGVSDFDEWEDWDEGRGGAMGAEGDGGDPLRAHLHPVALVGENR